LRHLLKYALRCCGLRAVVCVERNELAPAVRRRRLHTRKHAERRPRMVAVKNYLGSNFLKLENVRAYLPIEVQIVDIVEGDKYDKLEATLSDGTRLSLNVTNTRVLAKAYGATDTDDWVGKTIRLVEGEVPGRDGTPQPALLIEPVSPEIEKKVVPPPKPKGDMDDEIPF